MSEDRGPSAFSADLSRALIRLGWNLCFVDGREIWVHSPPGREGLSCTNCGRPLDPHRPYLHLAFIPWERTLRDQLPHHGGCCSRDCQREITDALACWDWETWKGHFRRHLLGARPAVDGEDWTETMEWPVIREVYFDRQVRPLPASTAELETMAAMERP